VHLHGISVVGDRSGNPESQRKQHPEDEIICLSEDAVDALENSLRILGGEGELWCFTTPDLDTEPCACSFQKATWPPDHAGNRWYSAVSNAVP
jgi:hypothetical protein